LGPLEIFLLLWVLLPLALLPMVFVLRRRARKADIEVVQTRTRFGRVVSIDVEVSKQEQILSDLEEQETEYRSKIDDVRADYKIKRKTFSELEAKCALYDSKLAFAELGIYEPHFDFGDSEVFKTQITTIRQRQKEMVSSKQATHCPADWTVDGSRSKGQAMVSRQTRLTMRAFNNECEAAIANARWNNVVAMEKRILNSVKQIDSANTSMSLVIDDDYIALKLDELHLTHEYREQLKIEKDERAELARAEREEKKLLAQADAADREERKYQALLDKARKEAGVDEGKIAELEAALAEARETGERARAMAEMTKSGYVYVISNIGSFGEDVVKIGLTRRLEPDDRVRELGDASVPFGFDTHAMIYSAEAPALESALHKEFDALRVNAANMRKEFFRVGLDDVESAVRRLAPDASFFRDREAQDWHETLARRNAALADMQVASGQFPESL
jgi:uncharacterized coiled-coil protein SlyX